MCIARAQTQLSLRHIFYTPLQLDTLTKITLQLQWLCPESYTDLIHKFTAPPEFKAGLLQYLYQYRYRLHIRQF